VSSRAPSGSRSWRFSPSILLRVPPMEVERFKHRELAPTVGPSSRSSGKFEGPLSAKSIYSMTSKWSSSNSKQVVVFLSRRNQINLLDEQVTELAVPEGSKIFSTRLLCASRRSNFFSDSIRTPEEFAASDSISLVLNQLCCLSPTRSPSPRRV
jgi:hypothetical protein